VHAARALAAEALRAGTGPRGASASPRGPRRVDLGSRYPATCLPAPTWRVRANTAAHLRHRLGQGCRIRTNIEGTLEIPFLLSDIPLLVRCASPATTWSRSTCLRLCAVRALISLPLSPALLRVLWQLRGLIKHQSPLLSRVRRRRRFCLCCAFLWRQFMRLSVAVMDPLSSDGKGLFSDGSPIRRVESAAPSSRGSRSSDYFQEGK
jgi:hypothetical protein